MSPTCLKLRLKKNAFDFYTWKQLISISANAFKVLKTDTKIVTDDSASGSGLGEILVALPWCRSAYNKPTRPTNEINLHKSFT